MSSAQEGTSLDEWPSIHISKLEAGEFTGRLDEKTNTWIFEKKPAVEVIENLSEMTKEQQIEEAMTKFESVIAHLGIPLNNVGKDFVSRLDEVKRVYFEHKKQDVKEETPVEEQEIKSEPI